MREVNNRVVQPNWGRILGETHEKTFGVFVLDMTAALKDSGYHAVDIRVDQRESLAVSLYEN